MQNYRVLGCMTGTSCDGVNLAYLETDGADVLQVGPFQTIPFAPQFRNSLLERIMLRAPIHYMDTELAKTISTYIALLINEFISQEQLTVDAIGFHGQTVWHDPKNRSTVQLGDCQHLANLTRTQVVGQFRQNDINNGGQGAPLVPIYHLALAAKLKKPLAFLNIGGVANLTLIKADNAIAAGDTGPGNALIDDWMDKHTGVPQDTDGKCAAQGTSHPGIIQKWLQHPFFELPFPKSLDRMQFHDILEDCQPLSIEDGAATLTQFTIETIIKGLELFAELPQQLIACGGGCHNQTLMHGLSQRFTNTIGAHEIGYDPDAIEAQLMGYLAARFFAGLPASFPSTTGVKEPLVAGELFLAKSIESNNV